MIIEPYMHGSVVRCVTLFEEQNVSMLMSETVTFEAAYLNGTYSSQVKYVLLFFHLKKHEIKYIVYTKLF